MPLIQTKIWRRPIPLNPPLTPRAVAAGTGGQIHTIERNQTTATARASGVTNNLAIGVWTGQSYILGSDAGDILYSPDGITWTLKRTGTGPVRNIIHNGYGRLIAFFNQNVVGGVTTIPFVRSEDYGVTWSALATTPASGRHGGLIGAVYNPYRNEVMVAYDRNILGTGVVQGIMYEIINFETCVPIGTTVNSVSNADGYALRFLIPNNPAMFSPIDNSYYYMEWNNANFFWTRRDPITLARSRVYNPTSTNRGPSGQASTLYTESSSVRICFYDGAAGGAQTKRIHTSPDMINYPVTANLANLYSGIAFAWNPSLDYICGGTGSSITSNQPGCHIAWGGVSPTFIFLSSYGTAKSVGPYCAII